jgi:hypothetical protein
VEGATLLSVLERANPNSRTIYVNTVNPALNGPFIKRKFVLNGNIFRSCDFGAKKDVKYPGLKGNCLMGKRKSI